MEQGLRHNMERHHVGSLLCLALRHTLFGDAKLYALALRHTLLKLQGR